MQKSVSFLTGSVMMGCLALGAATVRADDDRSAACRDVPSHAALRAALEAARAQGNGGFSLDMWGTVVNRDGVVCAVAFTGNNRGDQWPGSRVISAQKANTANAFSLPGLALSTANLYTATQPGGSLFGLQESNPVSTDVAYGGNPAQNGQGNDPMVGFRIGGVNVFGGGLALYNPSGKIVGGIGVSGDSSCRPQHRVADASYPEPRFRPRGRQWGRRPPGQHRVRHHAAGGPDARRQRRRMGPRLLQRGGQSDRRWPAAHQITHRQFPARRVGAAA